MKYYGDWKRMQDINMTAKVVCYENIVPSDLNQVRMRMRMCMRMFTYVCMCDLSLY
jgi:hypothetical protein